MNASFTTAFPGSTLVLFAKRLGLGMAFGAPVATQPT
jgi:hypothetical protein